MGVTAVSLLLSRKEEFYSGSPKCHLFNLMLFSAIVLLCIVNNKSLHAILVAVYVWNGLTILNNFLVFLDSIYLPYEKYQAPLNKERKSSKKKIANLQKKLYNIKKAYFAE